MWTKNVGSQAALQSCCNISTFNGSFVSCPERYRCGSIHCVPPFTRSLELTIAIPHNQNWQDWGARLNRKTAFHAAVNHYCREIGINWANSPQPIFITSYDSKNPPAADELEVGDDAGDDLSPNPVSPGGIDPAVPSNQPTMFFTPPKDDTRAGLRRRRKGNAGRANF